VEAEIEKIDNRLAVANKPPDLTVSIKDLREFVARKAFDLILDFYHLDTNVEEI
jgi:hypothetical protein